ncbi:DUF4142 domain-containing protein [Telmatocola sphagniphila]|uniref:DUF4142 domain-containing protein n=1 Tax=Telmatocola sphagniphila TaxID=1123043 RepID=A0A8E6B292_9BACT|nr:DUF4142 domain-containing protein [Telmatocola sphagniphila]QVL29934.1 DUF4142 domain-containing protein [Telmatocola sphagniphila]
MKIFELICMALLFILSITTAELPQKSKEEKKAFDDADFVKSAFAESKQDLELGKLAMMMGSHSEVKKIGEQFSTEHSKICEDLKTLAGSEKFPLIEKLSSEQQQEYDQYKSLARDKFDKEFVQRMIKTHEQDIEKYNQVIKDSQNVKLKEFAERTLPVLKDHLKQLRKIGTRD